MAGIPLSMPNGMGNDINTVLRDLERGLVVGLFFPRKKPEKRTLSVRLETRQLIWVKTLGSRPEGTVDLREVKEIRPGKNSKDFEKWADEARKADKNLCFVIFHGSEFKLATLSIAASNKDEFRKWLKGLNHLVQDTQNVSYQLQVERWLRKEFYLMEKLGTYVVTQKHLKGWMLRINYKIASNKLRDKFQEVDKSGTGSIGFEEFAALFRNLIHVPSIITERFSNYFEFSGNIRTMSPENFQLFLLQEQRDSSANDINVVKDIMKTHLDDAVRAAAEPYFTEQEFEDYLFSKPNQVWDTKYDKVTQDMNHPLSHYWIASSHNTYLTGCQLRSDSSVEAYARCLRMGCRCIELDCWDGPEGYPHITHGLTLTSKIKFLDVLKTIAEHAWVTTDYPLILSIENHCTLPQQRKMAMAFKDMFRDDLLVDFIDKDETQLPSPNQLRKKILLKNKKLQKGAEECVVNADDNNIEADLSNSVKNGIMYLEDSIDHVWHPHIFVLTTAKLLYAEDPSAAEQDEDQEDEENSLCAEQNCSSDELHFGEKWFHGKLEGGRHRAEWLLHQYKSLGDGTFLVRESETFIGDFSLSFLRKSNVNHCRIKSKQDRGQLKYYLIDTLLFDSLYSLITYYRQNPLRSSDFELTLKEPIPQPQCHEGKEWFYGDIDRVTAEDKLKRIPRDGAFLVRRSETDQYAFVISFRCEGKIKHCRIKQEGRLFTIGTAQFESLLNLIKYHEKNPLYKKMRLRYPVTDQLIMRMGIEPDDGNIHGDEIYYMPKYTSKVKVKAIQDYQAKRPDELSFRRGSIVNNVHKQEGGWWRGDYGTDKQHWFPANYVEEIDGSDDTGDTSDLGSLQKGSIDLKNSIIENVTGPTNLFVFRIYNCYQNSPLEIGCETSNDFVEWFSAISKCIASANERVNHGLQLERTKHIAQEFSDLIVYCQAVPYKFGNYYEMSSLPETKAEKMTTKKEAKLFAKYNRNQLSRIYPGRHRVDSSNFYPVPMWCCGSQMLALNYQTGDRSMHLHHSRFAMNGQCGYILQPECMRAEDYDPFSVHTMKGIEPMMLTMTIIGARHLVKQGRGIASPLVEVEVCGLDCDTHKWHSSTKVDSGLNPVWNEVCHFDIECPDLALLRIVVQVEDMVGDPSFLGQAGFPVHTLRYGYRVVPLLNAYSEELELASLLIHFDIRNTRDSEDQEIYSSIQELRKQADELMEQLEDEEDVMQRDIVEQQLNEATEKLQAKREERKQKKQSSRSQIVYRRTANN
ncbi:1-phosphatidylinositol 4,5-bisphosphate phosphodiesterase gamma-1 isoform X4 [Octopus sinensis]|uniref:1-phosphatidylinositol 4,5-bisphosphate phosphodiesterase gamma n=1 Tax=Octopus sinensis TaxID=2607531 RepID=A0A6P7T7K4_9MOLL|nr:1-phosphatidylinositol 4,5-bisphosphate phosphodiesterase gamma-1 isoform X4 [Octopus sinensis]